MSHTDTYVSWLKNAYSTEITLISALEAHIADADKFPDLQTDLLKHLQQTRQHADLIVSCLKRRGGKPSAVKSALGKVASAAIDVVNNTASDDVMKNTVDDFTAESIEIAVYATLIVAAEALGDVETAQICQQILREEEQAAEVLLSRHVPEVARAALAGAAHSTA